MAFSKDMTMDFNVSLNALRGPHPAVQRASGDYLAALVKWEKSASGSAVAVQRIRTWVEKGDYSARLELGQLDLISCPPLPTETQRLCLAFNPRLDSLPQPLPPELRELNIQFCNFTRLPHDWPVGLTELRLVTNHVEELPETLPAGLERLYATNNLLTSVPRRLPDGLQELYLASNAYTELNPSVLSLPNCKKINLCNNPLSETAIAMLTEHTGAQSYTGPAVKIGTVDGRIDMSSWLPEARTREMQESEGPPVIHPPAGRLTSAVNAMLRDYPGQLVASYGDQHRTVVQLLGPSPASVIQELHRLDLSPDRDD